MYGVLPQGYGNFWNTVLSIDDMMTKGSWTSCALPGLGATLELDADLASPGRRKADFCVSGGTKELSTLEANEPAGRASGGGGDDVGDKVRMPINHAQQGQRQAGQSKGVIACIYYCRAPFMRI
jgi:hypothetical protein